MPTTEGRKWYDLEGHTDDAVFGGQESAFSSLKLTRYQRLTGFGACFVIGFGVSLLGAIMLFIGFTGAFATLFGVGTIVSLIGTGFIVGFKHQMESAFKLKRVAATVILVVALVMTFVAAFVLPAILCIIFVIIQYLAYLWYSLSYLPGAHVVRILEFFNKRARTNEQLIKSMVGMK